jgi:hypothetical protein
VAYLLKRRSATTTFQWVKGHEGNQGNEESDHLAKEGAEKELPDAMDLNIPAEYDLQGAKLSALTQAITYKGIQERKPKYLRVTTSENIQRAREAIHAYSGTLETDESIWKGIYSPVIRIKIRQFLFKLIHGTQKIGEFWSHIRGYEDREICGTCQHTESMEHILTSCQEPTRQIIWDLAKNFWPHENEQWPIINLGTILGCGNLHMRSDEDQARPAGNIAPRKSTKSESKLLQILVSESAYLIWAIRCERVIQEKWLDANKISAKWHRTINKRLTEDRLIATEIKRSKYVIGQLRNTWEKALKKHREIPETWIYHNEVLVGRRQ